MNPNRILLPPIDLLRKGGSTYQFDANGLLTSITDLAGNVTALTYTNNLLTTIADPANRQITLQYSNGVLSSITDCVGRVWHFSWNANYDTQIIYDPLLNGSQTRRLIGYDANYNVNLLSNRLSKTWHYSYSSTGGVFLGATDPDSHAWSLAYAAPDASISWPATAAVQANWTNSNSKITKYAFDAAGQTVGINDATNLLVTFAWDTRRNRTDQWTPSGAHTQWGYDGRGNLTSIIDPFGNQTVKTYDYNNGDQLATVTDPLNHTTINTYPQVAPFNGNLLSVQDARGGVTQYLYNANGTANQRTDAENRVTKYGYDQWGHMNKVEVVQDATTSYITNLTYSKDSLLQTRTDARGRVTNLTYDTWGRLTQKDYPTSGRHSVTLVRDVEGRLTQATDGTGVRNFDIFDCRGRCVSMRDPMAGSNNPLKAAYDGEGNLLWQYDVTGRKITYGYDDANRLLTLSDSPTNALATQAIYAYDPEGKPLTLIYPNGTKTTFAHDKGRPLRSTLTKISDGSTLVNYAIGGNYDNNQRPLQVAEQASWTAAGGDVTTLSYDEVSNLLTESRVGNSSYSGSYLNYDKTNNRLSAVRVTNNFTEHNGAYHYDGAGRLYEVDDAATGQTENYTSFPDGLMTTYAAVDGSVQLEWDEEGRVVSKTYLNSDGTQQLAYEYGYAYDGNKRWEKDYNNNVLTWYPCGVACSAGQLAELVSDLSGQTWNTSALYLSDPRAPDQPIRSNTTYSHYDLFGNAAVQTDASGNLIANSLYDYFGVQRYFGPQALQQHKPLGDTGKVNKKGKHKKPDRKINQPVQHCGNNQLTCLAIASGNFTACTNNVTNYTAAALLAAGVVCAAVGAATTAGTGGAGALFLLWEVALCISVAGATIAMASADATRTCNAHNTPAINDCQRGFDACMLVPGNVA